MQESYFLPKKDINPKIPILKELGEYPGYYFMEPNRINNPEIIHFRLGKPKPRMPILGDIMFSPHLVVSELVHTALSSFPQNNFQLIAAKIDVDGKLHPGYYGLHIFTWFNCLDREKSDCVFNEYSISFINKLVLNAKFLDETPLEKRLIFRLNEDISRILFHESIVTEINKFGATGIEWVNLTEATTKTLF